MFKADRENSKRLLAGFEKIYGRTLTDDIIKEMVGFKEGSQNDIMRITLHPGAGKQFGLPDTFILRGADEWHGLLERNIAHRLSELKASPKLYADSGDPKNMIMVLESKPAGTIEWNHTNPTDNDQYPERHLILESIGRNLALMHQQTDMGGVTPRDTGLTLNRLERQRTAALDNFILPREIVDAMSVATGDLYALERLPKVLSHLCLHPKNVLKDYHGNAYLIDFTESGFDAACIDFMNIATFFNLSDGHLKTVLAGYTADAQEADLLFNQCKQYDPALTAVARSCYPFYQLAAYKESKPELFENLPQVGGKYDLSGPIEQAFALYDRYHDCNVKELLAHGEDELTSWLANSIEKFMAYPKTRQLCEQLRPNVAPPMLMQFDGQAQQQVALAHQQAQPEAASRPTIA